MLSRVGSARLGAFAVVALDIGLLAFATAARAEVLDPRRLAMGGVVLSDRGGSGRNVAYAAVPHGRDALSHRRWIPLPLGLVQFAVDHPRFNPDSTDFNVFDIANLALRPPLNLAVVQPQSPESDIAIAIARDSLRIDLGDLRHLVPEGNLTIFEALSGGIAPHFGPVLLGLRAIGEADMTIDPDDALVAALRDAQAFQDSTTYGVSDHGRAQAALSFEAGTAVPVYRSGADGGSGDPRRDGSTALYLGARGKYLRGIAYADAHGVASATTGDPIFGDTNSLALDADATVRHSTDLFGGSGGGADLGAALFIHSIELGVGVNDVGSRIKWKTDVDHYFYDASADSFVHETPETDVDYTSHLPATTTLTAAWRPARSTFAVSAQHGVGRWTFQAGAEQWLSPLLVARAGWSLDSVGKIQYSAGGGVRFGPVGVDLGLASTSLTVTRERALEMALALVLY